MNRVLIGVTILVLVTLACGQYVPTVTPTADAPTAAPTPTVTPTAAPTISPTEAGAQDVAIVRQAFVNVRTEPDGAVIGYVEAGQEVSVLGCDGDWCEISTDALSGWIFRGCLIGNDDLKCEAR
jgi:hypothetical protein